MSRLRLVAILAIGWAGFGFGFVAGAADPPAPAAAPQPIEAPPLSGVVRDAEGKPLPDATVRALSSELSVALRERQLEGWVDPAVVRTNAEGAFAFAALEGQSFNVRVEAPLHAPTSVRDVARGKRITVDLVRGTTLHGRTVLLGQDRAVPHAIVRFCDEDASIFGLAACGSAESGEDGAFDFAALPAKPILVRATVEGHAASRVQRVEGRSEPLTLGLGPGAWIRGRVLDHRGRPVEGARIRVAGAQGSRERAAVDAWPVHSDREGAFAIEGLDAGASATLLAYRSDRPVAEAGPFAIEAGADLEAVVRMPAAAELRFGLVDPEGQELVTFDVFLRDSESPEDFGPLARAVPEASIQSATDGRFALRALEVGTFDVLVVPEGYADVRRDRVVLAPGESTDLGVLEARPGRTLTGQVSDPEGEPIPDAKVKAWDGGPLDARARESTADSEGRFAIAGLREDGRVTLYGEARGFFPRQIEVEERAESADLTLSPAGGLAGRVETSEGEPPAAFTIFVHAEADGTVTQVGVVKQQSFASGDGAWRIEDLGAGRYTVEARAQGWAPARRPGVEIDGAALVELPPLVLGRGAAVRGRVVVAGDSRPLGSATVEAAQGGGWIPIETGARAMTTTDDSGRFEVGGLEPGPVTLRASHPGFAPAELSIEIGGDAPPGEVQLELTPGGRLTGSVRNRDGLPLEGRALVLAEGTEVLGRSDDTTTTDAQGLYEFAHVIAGHHTLRLLPGPTDGFAVITKTAVVAEGEVAVVDFLPEPAIRLSGMVLRDGASLPRSSLYFTPAQGLDLTSVKLARAGDDGRYSIGLDAPGRYRVIVQTGTTGGSSTELDVPDEAEVVRDITLESSGISGTVSDENREPVPGAAVAARPDLANPASDSLFVAEADETGRYAIQGLAPGTYRVTAVASGYAVGERFPVEVEESGANGAVDFVLERGRLLRGRLLDPQGRGVAGAYVFAASSAAPDPLNPASAETDLHGAFEMTAPAEGPLDLSAYAVGWAPARVTGYVLDDMASPDALVLVLAVGGRVRVSVLDSESRPVAGVHVSARPVPAFVGSEIGRLLRTPPPTDATGAVLIDLLSQGTWELAVAGRADVPPVRVEIVRGVEREGLIRLP